MPIHTASQNLRRWLLPGLLAIVLGACTANSVTQREFVQAPKENRVFWVDYDHTVQFLPEEGILPDTESTRLDAFLRQIGASFQDTYTIDPGGDDPLAISRADALRAALRDRFPTIQPTTTRLENGPALNQTRLVVGRYVVVTPECGDWSKPSGTDIWNGPSSNFGCASLANLGLMVADPGDLIRGRNLAPGLAGGFVLGIERYRAGEVFEPGGVRIREIGSN